MVGLFFQVALRVRDYVSFYFIFTVCISVWSAGSVCIV